MADTKITALQPPQPGYPIVPSTDVLPIVIIADPGMAASGSTRKATVNQLLGAGGTATLASATITGDLTVDTNVLKVDTSNNRVGINMTPITPLSGVIGTTGAVFFRTTDPAAAVATPYIQAPVSTGFSSIAPVYGFWYQGSGIGNPALNNVSIITDSAERYKIDATGVATWSNVGGVAGTAMTLNSTGLGVGVTPAVRFDSLVADAAECGRFRAASGWLRIHPYLNATDYCRVQAVNGTNTALIPLTLEGQTVRFNTNGGIAATLDASGNLLVGTTSAGGRLDVQTATGDCAARIKSNAAGSNATLAIDYVNSYGTHIIRKSGTDVWLSGVIADTGATPNYKIQNGSAVGVQLVSGATAWTTLSDETVKDIIEPIGNAVAKVGSLRSVIGKFKTDSEGTRRSFLIAQDVKSVLPEAVDVVGENNELGLRYTEVIPLLVAAIKELTARVQTLEAR